MQFENYLKENLHRFDAELDAGLKGKANHPDMDRYLYEPLSTYTANGGKRHRPLICLLACAAVGGNIEDCMSAAVAIEHFHTAALIHDDIADSSELRRDEPCLHVSMGTGLAVNAGDLSLSLVNGTVINDPRLNDGVKLRVLKELIDMTARTVEGQALDLGWAKEDRFDITVEDYLAMARHKTAYYSGAVPLAVGAIIGGGTEDQIAALREFGFATGLAFQIQDDLLNIVGDKHAVGKDYRSDIVEGKRTMMVVHALHNSEDADELIHILRADAPSETDLTRAVDIMIESNSVDFAHEYAVMLTTNAKASLIDSLPPSESRELLLSMADFFVNRMQ